MRLRLLTPRSFGLRRRSGGKVTCAEGEAMSSDDNSSEDSQDMHTPTKARVECERNLNGKSGFVSDTNSVLAVLHAGMLARTETGLYTQPELPECIVPSRHRKWKSARDWD